MFDWDARLERALARGAVDDSRDLPTAYWQHGCTGCRMNFRRCVR